MRLVVCVVLLCSLALAIRPDRLQATNMLQVDEDTVVLVPSSAECDLNSQISVAYQRIPNERDPAEKSDFIGLFRKNDPTTVLAYDVAPLKESSQTGEVTLSCRRAGDMEVRIVRSPGKIIGRASLRVFGPCLRPDCTGHGSCVRGMCQCQAGWEGESCELLSGTGLKLGWVDHPTGEFYPGDELRAKLYHSETSAQSSGFDTVAVFAESAPTVMVSSLLIPAGESEVSLPVPSEPGTYFLKVIRGLDQSAIATSPTFGVYRPCPASCGLRGVCQKGACVCEPGFDRADCSRGPGVVNVTFSEEAYVGAALNVDFSRNETSGVLSDNDWIGVYKEHDDSTDNPEYFAFAISSKIYDPDVRARIDINITHGKVQLIMPYLSGSYVLKYVRADHARYFATPPFTVYEPCPSRCSDKGQCKKGICECNQGWTGDDCSQGVAEFSLEIVSPPVSQDLVVGDIITVNFTRPTGNNTNFDYIGVYGSHSVNNSDQLFFYAYAVADASSDGTQPETRGQAQIQLTAEGSMVLRYVNAYTSMTEVSSNDFTVYSDCGGCSDHGKCIKGACQCSIEWKGPDCSKAAGDIALTLTKGDPVLLSSSRLGFEVHVKRPVNHYHAGDFIALFNATGPFDMESNKGYSYAKPEDDTDVYLIINSGLASQLQSGTYIVKYFSSSHEELGQSAPFSFKVE